MARRKRSSRNTITLSSVFTDIANAIRQRSGTSEAITPSEMAQKILDIPGDSGGC